MKNNKYILIDMGIDDLSYDVLGVIASHLKPSHRNSARTIIKGILPILYSYSSNHPKFIQAYTTAISGSSVSSKSISIRSVSSVSRKSISTLITKYCIIYEDVIHTYVEKLNIFNAGIKSYLEMIKKSENNTVYLYGLAQLFSYKSGLTDLVYLHHIKYKILEYELYKLYLLRSFITINKKDSNSSINKRDDLEYLRDSIKWILNTDLNGIIVRKNNVSVTYVKKASPSRLLCSSFLNYYLWESEQSLEDFLTLYMKCHKEGLTNPIVTALTPKMIRASHNIKKDDIRNIIIKLKQTIFNNCIQFLITDEKYISQYTKCAVEIDLSLIDFK